uniref:Uncharacterized protein n=1 Tax=Zea mays TaxID=4577 RepID=C4J250_MAIZE|nr:unknown [Zea mays]
MQHSTTLMSSSYKQIHKNDAIRMDIIYHAQRLPPIRLASCMSFCMIVTRLAWMAHRFAISNSSIKWNSAASCSARRASAV